MADVVRSNCLLSLLIASAFLVTTATAAHDASQQHAHRRALYDENDFESAATATAAAAEASAAPSEVQTLSAHDINTKREVSARRPVYVLVPLPALPKDRTSNPFQITLSLAQPTVDVAREDVYDRELLERGSLCVQFRDTQLSDAFGPLVAIEQLVANKLDCIIGESQRRALVNARRRRSFFRLRFRLCTRFGRAPRSLPH